MDLFPVDELIYMYILYSHCYHCVITRKRSRAAAAAATAIAARIRSSMRLST